MNIRIQSLARICTAALLGLVTLPLLAADLTPEGIDFFEKKIRPLLAEHCFQCHSQRENKRKGGLLLDHRDGLLKGGDSGPAIVPGNPDASLLMRAVSYADDQLKMPPKDKKLAPQQIELLRQWIHIGAPDPRDGQPNNATDPAATDAANHWAFQPLRPVPVPATTPSNPTGNPVDAFILARLDSKNLTLSPKADPRTLLRRACFDLTGLPPTQTDIDDFIADPSPAAFARVVDRLLGSVHYGERWARYWLDIARYADTKGYVFTSERSFPFSYTYRDYVIRSFNEDLPFNRFLIEQIAADLLPLGDDKRPLAALGFLTLGRRFLNNQHDIIDDRIDVVTRGTMGLTVSCARCHDHKYDPIPTADYYSLYGIFASSSEPSELPLLGDNALPDTYPDYLAEKKKREDERDNYRREQEEETRQRIRAQVGDYLLAIHDATSLDDSARENLVRERKLDPTLAARWRTSLDQWQTAGHPLFSPWFALTRIPSDQFEKNAPASLSALANKPAGEINPIILKSLSAPPPSSLQEIAERYNALFRSISENKPESPLPDLKPLLDLLHGTESPLNLNGGELARLYPTAVSEKIRALQRRVDRLESTHSGVPPRAMALQDNSSPHEPRIFIRGNSGNHGAKVPRQFLGFLEGSERKPYTEGSGRLQLAQAIASPTNPLTARVIVNRVWTHHFGKPLVDTQSDFGVRAEPPTHPELLDYLASRFINEGWSIKKLHRLIMLSHTYQQSSQNNPAAAKIDPANQLLWRMNRQRLDFEAMRDTLLAVSGELDLTVGGRSVEITEPPYSPRRAVYGLIERQNLPDLFRTFDFASPDTTSPGRFSTTVPQQALFLLNSPFAIEQAKHLAHRPELSGLQSNKEKVFRLYELAYQRHPDPDELKWALAYLEQESNESDASSLSRLEQYAQTLLVANELFFVD